MILFIFAQRLNHYILFVCCKDIPHHWKEYEMKWTNKPNMIAYVS